MDLRVRILMFIIGAALTAFSVALFFKTYFYPQVYDFFVKAVSQKYNIRLAVFKTIVDLSCLTASIIMTFCFFGKIVGINWGTLVIALFNGTVIGLFSNMFDKYFTFPPFFKKFSTYFALDK